MHNNDTKRVFILIKRGDLQHEKHGENVRMKRAITRSAGREAQKRERFSSGNLALLAAFAMFVALDMYLHTAESQTNFRFNFRCVSNITYYRTLRCLFTYRRFH